MLGCFGPPVAKEADGVPKRSLSRADTRKEKQHRKSKQKVERQTSSYGTQGVGFSFSGAGFLFPYFAGVAATLVQSGLITATTHLAGASAGSLIAVNVNCGLSPEEGFDSCLQFADDCRRNGIRGRLKQALRQHLLNTLPADAHLRVEGRTHVAVTQAVPLKRRIVSSWKSLDDLVDCLVASCHLPRYSDDKLTSLFRGKAHMDGGVLNFIPAIPDRRVLTVGVCCFPKTLLAKLPVKAAIKNLCICPDMFEPEDWQYTMKELLAYAFEPGSDAFLRRLYARGRRDAHLWSRSMGLVSDSPAPSIHLPPSPPVHPASIHLPPSPPVHPGVPAISSSGSGVSSPCSSMQTGSELLYVPSGMRSDSMCASGSSGRQLEPGHHVLPMSTGSSNGHYNSRGLQQDMSISMPASSSSSSTCSTCSTSYTDAVSVGPGSSDSSRSSPDGEQFTGDVLASSMIEGSNPYSDALEVVNSLSSSSSCELGCAGIVGPADVGSPASEVIHEHAAGSAARAD